MTPTELAARAHRRRQSHEIEADLQAACRAVGALAGGAKLTGSLIDRQALRNSLQGIRALLAEPTIGIGEDGSQ